MLAVHLPPDVEERLDALSRRTGRSREDHVRDAILDHLENLEDIALADRRLEALAQGDRTVPLAELMKRHGMGD